LPPKHRSVLIWHENRQNRQYEEYIGLLYLSVQGLKKKKQNLFNSGFNLLVHIYHADDSKDEMQLQQLC
jgi:hypothetical protein